MNEQLRRDTLDERIERVVREVVEVVPYDPNWPASFRREKAHLESCLSPGLIRRIEHVGSTAIPGLAAKPIIDVLVEVVSLDEAKQAIVPILQSQGYDYFWRPTWGDDGPPWYAWFIKRAANGARTHHIHMVERQFPQWDALLFRDYLIEQPEIASAYQNLKIRLAVEHAEDRIAYTKAKAEFIAAITETARRATEQ